MNNRQIEMDNFLKYIQKIKQELNNNLTRDTVYGQLVKGLVNEEEKGKIYHFFPEFIEYFKNKKNISVFNRESWKYYCQFRNIHNYENSPLFNPIKMYLSVSKQNIKNFAITLFDFLEKNDIRHESKIASEVRTDDIVIRVYSKEDELKIRNYINNNEFLRNSLMKQSPFCFQENNIGYALDGETSYNLTLSKYIRDYINSLQNDEEASLQGFTNFVTNIYNNVFVYRQAIDEYIEKYIDEEEIKYFEKESMLNNYEEITKLLLLSIRENSLDWFMGMVDSCNDKDIVNQNINSYSMEDKKEFEKKIIYLNKAIIETYKKYDLERGTLKQVTYALQLGYLYGNFSAFTNENQARNNLKNNLNKSDIKKIIDFCSKGNIEVYIESCLESEKKDDSYIENLDSKVLYLNRAILETYKKYNFEQVVKAIYEAINNNDFGYFTNTSQARDNLIKNVSSDEIKNIIGIYANGDIYIYVNKCIEVIKDNDNYRKI